MKLIINGDPTILPINEDKSTLEMVLNQLGHHPQSIVVEFNGIIINRKKWADQQVKNGDKLEIVTIVGGGS